MKEINFNHDFYEILKNYDGIEKSWKNFFFKTVEKILNSKNFLAFVSNRPRGIQILCLKVIESFV